LWESPIMGLYPTLFLYMGAGEGRWESVRVSIIWSLDLVPTHPKLYHKTMT